MAISKLLLPVRRRIMAQHYLEYLLRGLLAGLALSVAFLIISFIVPWLEVGQICLQTVVAAMLLALLLAWGSQPDLWQTACLVDNRGLKERVSTALELIDQESAMALRQRQDALEQLRAYDWRIHFPWTLPRFETRLLGAAILALALLCLLPNPQQEQIDRQLAINQEIKQQEKKIAALKKELQKKEQAVSDTQRQEAVKALQELQESLGQSSSLKTALQSLALAEEKLAALNEAELQRVEPGAAKSGVSPHDGKLAPLNERSNTAPKNADGDANSEQARTSKAAGEVSNSGRPSSNTQGNSAVLADLQRAVQGIGDARMALLGAASSPNAQLAAASGGMAGTGSDARSNQGASDGTNVTAASGMEGNSDSPGSPGGSNSSGSVAGQQGTGNAGSGNSGSGNQAAGGNNPGSGSGPGAGQGSGNGDGSSGQESESTPMPGSGFPDMKSKAYEKIYDPERPGLNGESSVVRGKAGNGPQQNVEIDDPALMPGLLRPYQEVIGRYSQAARESLGRSSVPAGMNEVVKDYFSSLEEE